MTSIERIRRRLKLSQDDLAKRLGVTRGAVSHWELGRRKVPGPVERLLKQIEQEGKV